METKKDSLLTLRLDDLLLSEIYLQEREVSCLMRAVSEGKASVPPIKVYFHPVLHGVIWEGAAQAYVAKSLGYQVIQAEEVPPGTPGEDHIIQGVRCALASGIRGVQDLTAYHIR